MAIIPSARGIEPLAGNPRTMKLKVPIDFADMIKEALSITSADSQQQIKVIEKIEAAVISVEFGPFA